MTKNKLEQILDQFRTVNSRFFSRVFGSTSSVEAPMSQSEFTVRFAEQLVETASNLNVEVKEDLRVYATDGSGAESTAQLDNAYREYSNLGGDVEEILQRHISSTTAFFENDQDIEIDRIIPLIRHSVSMDENPIDELWEQYNDELSVVYAQDLPTTISYLCRSDLIDLQISIDELKIRALDNLREALPDVEFHELDDLMMVTAGGNYEASLILLDEFWSDERLKFDGDLVVGLPTRDLLLITGSNNEAGMELLASKVSELFEGGSYQLSNNLFVWKDSRLVPLRS